MDISSPCLLANRGNRDRALAEVVLFHFYLPIQQNGLVVREKYILNAFGLSPITASGELFSLLSMLDLTF